MRLVPKQRLITICLVFLASTLVIKAAPMYLPSRVSTVTTQAIGDIPVCSAVIELDQELKHITRATLTVGMKKYAFPPSALAKIEFPDPSSMKIETEVGRKGGIWFSLVLSPSRHSEYLTRYHISVVDGEFSQVTKMWDEPKEGRIKRHFAVLHRHEKSEQGGVGNG